ncbi:MAG: CHAD domain-containing protein [Vicinamibacterales bacterium]|nr:CHAD domain-containing protein [Vicinamibacterales bacterium]
MRLTDPRRVARRRLLALAQQRPLALAGNVEAVHQARVASRRLREFLPLLAPAPDNDRGVRTLRRQVRRVTRALGPVRELDVAMLTLDGLAAARPVEKDAIAFVRATLERARAEAAAQMEAVLTGAAFDRIRAGVVEAAAAFASPAARRTLALSLAVRVASRAAAAGRAVGDTGTVFAPDRLHRARIALKKCRYTMELAQDCGGVRLSGSLRRLKEVQDILGTLHDHDVLAARIRDGAADAGDQGWRAALAALASHLDHETRERHSEFLTARADLAVVFYWARRVAGRLGDARDLPARI